MATRDPYKIVSLFSGCGGLDLGFIGGFEYLGKKYRKRNFEIIWANDIDKSSGLTYEKNFGHTMHVGDIRDYLKDAILPETADIVLGGFPCQDFSHAGKRRGFTSERGRLYQAMVEVIKKTQPALFVAENVKGLLTMNQGEAIQIIESDFTKLGYNTSIHLYYAADYGVPQSRERVLIVGTNQAKNIPTFSHPKAKVRPEKWLTLSSAIGDLEHIAEGDFSNHFWSKAKYFKGTQGNTFVAPDKIGPTMRAEHHGNIEWHWNKKRRLSAREAARIQTFPDDFTFLPSTSQAYRQIGNAVPPLLAWHVAGAIQKHLDTHI